MRMRTGSAEDLTLDARASAPALARCRLGRAEGRKSGGGERDTQKPTLRGDGRGKEMKLKMGGGRSRRRELFIIIVIILQKPASQAL